MYFLPSNLTFALEWYAFFLLPGHTYRWKFFDISVKSEGYLKYLKKINKIQQNKKKKKLEEEKKNYIKLVQNSLLSRAKSQE